MSPAAPPAAASSAAAGGADVAAPATAPSGSTTPTTSPAAPTAAEGGAPEASAPATQPAAGGANLAPPDVHRAAVNGQVACLPGRSLNSDDASTETVADMVCDALRKNGVNVVTGVDVAAVTGEAYVVRMQPLGQAWVIRVSHDQPLGTEVDSRQLVVRDLVEAPVVARRIGRAFARGEPVEDTQQYTTVTQTEARPIQKRSGEVVVGPGISSVYVGGSDGGLASGLNFNLYYEYPRWALGFGSYFGGSHNTVTGGVFIGGRYYLSDEDITPLLGAGVMYGGTDVANASGGGTSFYADVGVEFFRLGKTHLSAYLRAEAPTYQLKQYHYDSYSSDKTTYTYRVPVGLHLNVGF